MINFDMVGRLRGDTLAVYENGTSPVWNDILETQWGRGAGFELVLSESGSVRRTHGSTEDILRCTSSRTARGLPQTHRYRRQTQREGMVRIADFAACT